MYLKEYIKFDGKKGYLSIKVIPNSRETEFVGIMDDGVIKIKIKSVPEKGKANKELIEFLSKELNVKKSNFIIISGAGTREKLIRIDF